jgi:hypothetical protein
MAPLLQETLIWRADSNAIKKNCLFMNLWPSQRAGGIQGLTG